MDCNTTSNIVNIFSALGGAFVGAIVGSFFTYKYSISILKKQEFIKACSKFRIAFMETIISLDKESINFVDLDNFIPTQQIAFYELLAHLPCGERKRFNLLWEEYAYPNKKDFPKNPRLEYKSMTPEEDKEVFKKLRKRINALMEFAEIAN